MVNTVNKNKIPQKVIDLMNCIMSEGYEIYLVGGCVRDMLMGKEPHDFDFCTNAEPDALVKIYQKNDFGINPKGIEYGTVTAVIKNEEFEVTTYREDLDYIDSRHPEGVNYTQSLVSDLSRRDFTINAIAYNPITDEIVDPFDGVNDIRNKVIRTVRNPQDRFQEDALRIMRGLRFAITLGFDIDQNTFEAMLANKALLVDKVSKERVTDEFKKTFKSNMPVSEWFMRGAPIVFTLIPELKVCYNFDQNNKYHHNDVYKHLLAVVDFCDTTKFEVKMAALLHDIGKPATYVTDEHGKGHFYGHPEVSFEICKQIFASDFRLSNDEEKAIENLIRYHDIEIPLNAKSVRRVLSKRGQDFFDDYLILHKADVADHVLSPNCTEEWTRVDELKEIYDTVLKEDSCFKISDLAINGKDVMKIGKIKSGPLVGSVLNHLLNEVMDQNIENTKDALVSETMSFLTKQNNLNSLLD